MKRIESNPYGATCENMFTGDAAKYSAYEKGKQAQLDSCEKEFKHRNLLTEAHYQMELKEKVREILNSMALERCDPDVMPYFEDYYWLPKDVWQTLKQEVNDGS